VSGLFLSEQPDKQAAIIAKVNNIEAILFIIYSLLIRVCYPVYYLILRDFSAFLPFFESLGGVKKTDF